MAQPPDAIAWVAQLPREDRSVFLDHQHRARRLEVFETCAKFFVVCAAVVLVAYELRSFAGKSTAVSLKFTVGISVVASVSISGCLVKVYNQRKELKRLRGVISELEAENDALRLGTSAGG